MSVRVATADLERAVAASVARLGRFGSSYPVYFEPPPGHEIVPAESLLEPKLLRRYSERAILEWTKHPEEEDIRAAVSRFMRRYCGSLADAALLPLALGVAFDVSIPRVSFLIRTDMPMGVVLDLRGAELCVTAERSTGLPVEGATALPSLAALRERAIGSLIGEHLAPAIARTLDFVHLSPKLLWATAAEQIDMMYENAAGGYGGDPAVAYTGRDFAPFDADRTLLLFADTLPGVAGPNPLKGMITWEDSDGDPGLPRPLQVRDICCANYVIPGRNAYCRTCGLIPKEQRLRMWRGWLASIKPK